MIKNVVTIFIFTAVTASLLLPRPSYALVETGVCIEGGAQILGTSVKAKGPLCVITNPPGFNLLSMDSLKEWILKPAARLIIRALLQATTQQIVFWIQGDGGKNVGYVKNFEQALRREADAAGGEFLNQLTGINLCGNIGVFLNLSLRTPGLRQRLECTVSDIVANLNNFYRNFEEGGWPAFIRISLDHQNNPYGAYLIALDAKISAEERRKQGFLEPLRKSFPFEGFKVPKEVCDTVSAEVAETVSRAEAAAAGAGEEEPTSIRVPTAETLRERGVRQVCRTEYEIKTPGQLISDGLTKATFSGIDFANNAKDFDEAIAVIINALINKLITTAFVGSDSSTSGQGVFDTGFSNIPREDLSQSVIVGRLYEGIFLHDKTLGAIEDVLIADRRKLFASRKRLDELQKQDPLGGDPNIQVEIGRTKDSIKANEDAIRQAILNKEKLLSAGFELFSLQTDITATSTTPDGVRKIVEQIPAALTRLTSIISSVGLTGTTGLATGNTKLDVLDILTGSVDNLTRALVIVEDTGKEIERMLALGSLSQTKQTALKNQRSALLIQHSLLSSSLNTSKDYRDRLIRARSDTTIRDIVRNASQELLTTRRRLSDFAVLLLSIDDNLKP